MDKLEIKQFLREINRSEAAIVKIGNVEASTDLFEHARLVDAFASRYGLGGCKSLTEFWEMINEEDPLIVQLLEIAAYVNNEESVGKEKFDLDDDSQTYETSYETTHSSSDKYVNNDNIMAEFLMNMGADHKEVTEALKNSTNRKNSVDIGDITDKNLRDPNFDLEDAIKRLDTRFKNSKEFEVSSRTIRNRKNG